VKDESFGFRVLSILSGLEPMFKMVTSQLSPMLLKELAMFSAFLESCAYFIWSEREGTGDVTAAGCLSQVTSVDFFLA